MDRDAGFSLLEITVALALMLLVTTTAFALLAPAEGAFSAVQEVSDMDQRLRVATDTLSRTLMMAGAGASLVQQKGGLQALFAPVLPFRRGLVDDAAPGSYTTDTITVFYVPPAAAQTTTSVPVVAANAALRVNAGSGCPRAPDGAPDVLCGFASGMSLLIVDEVGRYDVFTVTGVDGDTAQLAVKKSHAAATTIYPSESTVVEVVDRTYALRVDMASRVSQLVTYDGSDRADVPVVDNVVALTFEYFGDPHPPSLLGPLDDPTGPWTSYGPRPPLADLKTTAYPEGENCTFMLDGDRNHVPRLATLNEGSNPHALVRLTEAQLTDGPWCPDIVSPDRFDADLLRIRAIAVTLRLQAAVDALRGPAGPMFFNGGTATNGSRWVPDQEVRFEVAPRNLNLGR